MLDIGCQLLSSKKVLIISYSYAPDLSPRAFRWTAVSNYLAYLGFEVHVLCAGAQIDNFGSDDNRLVIVHRVGDWLLSAAAWVSPKFSKKIYDPHAQSGFLFKTLILKLFRAVWRALYWPDYACGWIIPAMLEARMLCAKNEYDWIISVSHPFSGHLVGMAAKRCSPRSRWFVDIGDPYSQMREPSPNNYFIYSYISRIVESRVISGATVISVTTDSTKALYESCFPESSGKVYVIPPLLSLPNFTQTPLWRVDGTIRLVFVGTLYKKLRSPKYLLACVVALSRAFPASHFDLHFFGLVNDCGDDFLMVPDIPNCRVLLHGLVCREEAAQAMNSADILVNIGNDSESQLPSKVIEYMATGKPILNFVSIERDASIKVLVDYPSMLTISRLGREPSWEVIKTLGDFIFNSRPVDKQVIDLILSRFSEAHVAGTYASILEQ